MQIVLSALLGTMKPGSGGMAIRGGLRSWLASKYCGKILLFNPLEGKIDWKKWPMAKRKMLRHIEGQGHGTDIGP